MTFRDLAKDKDAKQDAKNILRQMRRILSNPRLHAPGANLVVGKYLGLCYAFAITTADARRFRQRAGWAVKAEMNLLAPKRHGFPFPYWWLRNAAGKRKRLAVIRKLLAKLGVKR